MLSTSLSNRSDWWVEVLVLPPPQIITGFSHNDFPFRAKYTEGASSVSHHHEATPTTESQTVSSACTS